MVKKFISIVLFVLFSAYNTYAYNDKNVERLIKAIGQVESRGNINAVSNCGKFVGYLQISKVVVDDCNRILGEKKYNYNHRFDKESSIEMFYIIQNYYNPKMDIEKAIRIWNGGPTYSLSKTQSYYNDVMVELSKILNDTSEEN